MVTHAIAIKSSLASPSPLSRLAHQRLISTNYRAGNNTGDRADQSQDNDRQATCGGRYGLDRLLPNGEDQTAGRGPDPRRRPRTSPPVPTIDNTFVSTRRQPLASAADGLCRELAVAQVQAQVVGWQCRPQGHLSTYGNQHGSNDQNMEATVHERTVPGHR